MLDFQKLLFVNTPHPSGVYPQPMFSVCHVLLVEMTSERIPLNRIFAVNDNHDNDNDKQYEFRQRQFGKAA